jgi:4-hydroxy-tetrahydrodipicolinate synthase
VGDDLEPLPELLVEHVQRLLEEGCHGVVLFGTTGEAPSFSVDERRALLDAVIAAGVPQDRIIAGVGCCALPDTLALARHAAEAGCAALLLLPPFYFKTVSDEGLFRAFTDVLDRIDRVPPVLLYHFPRLSQVPIPVRVYARLADRVAGIKDSSGETASLRAFVEAAPGLAVFPGTEALLLDGLRLGAAGVITAGANVNARAIRAVFDARDDADELQAAVTEYRRTLQRRPMIPGIKRILAERTGDERWANVRPPLVRV